ncbi:hypothetical protein TNCV_430921 [Trichonephila clavipes]|nr:hypothetical protein TNCV_430921 [Trichonephila clavipes]
MRCQLKPRRNFISFDEIPNNNLHDDDQKSRVQQGASNGGKCEGTCRDDECYTRAFGDEPRNFEMCGRHLSWHPNYHTNHGETDLFAETRRVRKP